MSESLFKPGTEWKCRDGNKVYIVGNLRDGRVVIERSGSVVLLFPTGMMFGDSQHSYDLIAPWTEPQTAERDILLLEDCCGVLNVLVERPGEKFAWKGKVLARKRIVLTEGEGLDD